MSSTIVDYLLVPDTYWKHDIYSKREVVRFLEPMSLGDNIWIGPIAHDLADAIMDACEPAGENFKAIRQFNCAYAIWNDGLDHRRDFHVFDGSQKLNQVVAASRLVHPTNICHEYAAQVLAEDDGNREIVPYGRIDLNSNAFVSEANQNWLIPADVEMIRKVLDGFSSKDAARVNTAFWYLEAAFHEYYLDLRWAMIVTALEGLTKIKDEKVSGSRVGSTKGFVKRLLRISDSQGLGVSEDDLRKIYEERSQIVHGLSVVDVSDEGKSLYLKAENFLREILRRIYVDPSFKKTFSSDDLLMQAFPIES